MKSQNVNSAIKDIKSLKWLRPLSYQKKNYISLVSILNSLKQQKQRQGFPRLEVWDPRATLVTWVKRQFHQQLLTHL